MLEIFSEITKHFEKRWDCEPEYALGVSLKGTQPGIAARQVINELR